MKIIQESRGFWYSCRKIFFVFLDSPFCEILSNNFKSIEDKSTKFYTNTSQSSS